ncbi:MAG: hypothetical protein R3Y53_00375 [Bacillota bacterium]
MDTNYNVATRTRTNFDPVPPPKKVEFEDPIVKVGQSALEELLSLKDDKSAIQNKSSNFETFIRMLKNSPTILDVMGDLLGYRNGEASMEYANPEFTEALEKLFQQTDIPKEELAQMIKGQVEGATKFQTSLFDTLRNILKQTDSQEVQSRILNFAKKYNDFSASKHIMKNIVIELKAMQPYMGGDAKAILNHLTQKLNINIPMGDTKANLDVIRQEIIPFLGNYIKTTNDFGTLRDLITSMLLNTARYENSTKEGVVSAFETLLGFNVVKKGLDESITIHGILREAEMGADEVAKTQDPFVSLLQKGIEGKAGYENVEAFRQVITNILMNESVYLPLVHLTIPINIAKTLFFSDIWIDPNDGENEKSGGKSGEQRVKLYLKFDIKDLGPFDVIMFLQKETMDLQVYAPEKIASKEREVKKEVKSMIEKHGFRVGAVYVEKAPRPLTVLDVFPKVYEGKNAVNVRI